MNDPALESHLSPGEALLWSGAPKKRFRFERKHVPLLFFLVPFCFFIFIPVLAIIAPTTPQTTGSTTAESAESGGAATSSPAAPPQKPAPLAARILMAVFAFFFIGGIMAWILYCMGLTVGGNTFLQGATLYGITSQRIVIVTGRKAKTIRSIHLGTATDLRMKEWPDGLGNISFGPEQVWPYATSLSASNTVLENIAEPRKVFQLIIEARKRA